MRPQTHPAPRALPRPTDVGEGLTLASHESSRLPHTVWPLHIGRERTIMYLCWTYRDGRLT